MAANNLFESKPPDNSESSYSDTGQDVPDRTSQKIINSESPSCQPQTINEKLYNMPMEEFVILLQGCTDKSKVKPKSEQAEIISQLEHERKVQPDEEIPTLTNSTSSTLTSSKYSSSLQSLLQNQGKTSHKVATATGSFRPEDHSPNTFHCTTTTTSSCPLSCPTSHVNSDIDNLPLQYYFNCAQDQPPSNPNLIMNLRTFDNKESHNYEPHEEDVDIRRTNRSNNIQLINEPYDSVGNTTDDVTSKGKQLADDNLYDLTEASNDSSYAKSHRELIKMCTSGSSPNSSASLPASTSTLNSPISQTGNYQQNFSTPTLSQNSSSPPSSTVLRHSGPESATKKAGKKGNKNKAPKEVVYLPDNFIGWKGNQEIDELVQFVEGAPSGKRGNKKKERESRGKGNEPLVKSVSLDDDNLSLAAVKKTVDRNDRSSSLKDATGIQRSDRGREPVELDKKEKGGLKDSLSAGVKKSLASQGNRRESDPEDNRSPLRKNAETNFTVVIRKRRNKTACSTSEPGSGGDRDIDKRQELRRSGSRGERRKSVGSVPGSDQSEGSDDGSVRSLPAGKCTQRENVPMSCASSGGTPQTSYADIARLTKDEEAKRDFPQALEDYPSLHGGSENYEGSSDDGSSVRSLGLEENTSKLSSSVGATPHTSYADIARLASHEEKMKDEKRDRPAEEFPELSSTTTLGATSQDSVVEPVSLSPKSDLIGSASKYATNECAFPKLTASSASSASKNSLTQGSSSDVVSTGSSVIAPNKVTNSTVASHPVVVTPTTPSNPHNNINFSQSPNIKTTTITAAGATSQMSACTPFTRNASAPSMSLNTNIPITKKSIPNFTPASVLNSPTTVSFHSASNVTATNNNISSGVKLHSAGDHSGKSKNKELTNINLNGHLSDSEKDRAVKRSDNIGAKLGKSAFSVTIPQPFVVDLDVQCKEAVVFCGENFKEPPQLPSKDLQFEFGFDVNEALVGRGNVQQPPQKVTPKDGLYQVPDTTEALSPDSQNNNISNNSKDSEDQCTPEHVVEITPMEYRTPTTIRGVIMPTVILQYPVDFAQYFLPPAPILYINTNVGELGNIMERRAQEFHRLARDDSVRYRRVT